MTKSNVYINLYKEFDLYYDWKTETMEIKSYLLFVHEKITYVYSSDSSAWNEAS